MKIFTIIENTFKEAARDRLLIALLVIGFLLIASAKIVKPFALGEEAKIIKDLGLSSISIIALLVAILVGGRLVYKEIEKRTIYILLSKPVHRYQFIIGKYFGLLLVIFFTMTVLTGGFYLMLYITSTQASYNLLLALMMSFFELAIITAIALFFSAIATPITASLFTFIIYIISNFTRDLKSLAQISTSTFVQTLSNLLYYLLPNLSNFNIRGLIVHDVIINPVTILLSISYALIYSTLIIFLTVIIFQRKDF